MRHREQEAIPNRPVAAIALAAFAALCGASSAAQTEIHRCEQADGTIAFQEQPCPDPAARPAPNEPPADDAEGPADDFFDFDNPFDAPPGEAPEPPASDGPPSAERSACEKRTRDAIDEIDLEIRRDYSPERREDYLLRLRELTAELRACKRL